MRFLLSVLFFCYLGFVLSQTINNVRINDHTTYLIGLIQKTVDRIKKNNWNSLKLHEVTVEFDEEILNRTVQGTVTFKNGFIVSIQHLNLIPSTIQQVWLYTRATNTTTLELRSTMAMTGTTIGYDIEGTIDGEKYHNTGTMLYPVIQFQIAVIRNLYTEELSSRVVPFIRETTNLMRFLPADQKSQVLTQLYNWNSTFSSVMTWANEVLAPLVLEIVETESPIPPFCYDCPV